MSHPSIASHADPHITSYAVAVFHSDDEPGYWAEVLNLPGCVAQGKDLQELRRAVIDAIQAWEETRREMDGDETPRRHVDTMNILAEERDGKLILA